MFRKVCGFPARPQQSALTLIAGAVRLSHSMGTGLKNYASPDKMGFRDTQLPVLSWNNIVAARP